MISKYIYRFSLIALIGVGLTTSLNAHTALNCSKVLDMRTSRVEACANQTNDWLNDNYQYLLNKHKESPKQVKLLQEVQSAWTKKRDTQCGQVKEKAASHDGLATLRCEVLLTYQRANDLEKTLLTLGH